MEVEVLKIKFVFKLMLFASLVMWHAGSNWIVWIQTNFSSHLNTVSAITGIIYGLAGQRGCDLILLTLMWLHTGISTITAVDD